LLLNCKQKDNTGSQAYILKNKASCKHQTLGMATPKGEVYFELDYGTKINLKFEKIL